MHAVMFIKKKNFFYRNNWLATDLIQVKLVTKLYDSYQTLIWNFQYFHINKLNLFLLSLVIMTRFYNFGGIKSEQLKIKGMITYLEAI